MPTCQVGMHVTTDGSNVVRLATLSRPAGHGDVVGLRTRLYRHFLI